MLPMTHRVTSLNCHTDLCIALRNGGSRMGNLGQMPPPLHLVEKPAMLLIKIGTNFMSGQDQFINS